MINLVIPEGVEEIGESSIWDCENLESITLPKSLIKLGKNPIHELNSLKEIRIPKNEMSRFVQMGLKKLVHYFVEYEVEKKNTEEYEQENEELTILNNLSKAYELGIGVKKDKKKAMQFYKQAAEKGSVIAANRIAEIYLEESEKWRMKANGVKK